MLEGFQNITRIPELKRRILITGLLLIVYRIGIHIPTPGIDNLALKAVFESQSGTLFGLIDMFSGGALARFSIFTLGIMPYISSSIILQLLTVVIPQLEKLSKEGELGRRKITQYTRYGTIVLSVIQGMGIAVGLESVTAGAGSVVYHPGWAFRIMTVITLTSGTAFLMWLGEQITERGIGNGISLIIFAGIVARFPSGLVRTVTLVRTGEMNLFAGLFLLALMVGVVGVIIYFERAHRRIPVQYARRIVGRKVYGGQSTHLPLKVNTAGVIPPIFASSILLFPATIASFIKHPVTRTISDALTPGRAGYELLFVAFIVFFCYFYTAVTFNPVDVADNMKKYGGFVPGIRPGKKTAEYIDKILTRITLGGAIYVSVICVLPSILIARFNVPFYFGGTGLLIVVGVAMDTIQQIESHLITRHYEGFLKKGQMKGRRG
ncbi:MAG TPA: preprotein translocase subunit SecY [Deltaproteobacteria bacterium]|uniref:Protein translocase subunit SecY n=1 Tax=uncultured delta proteobacterium Rifle_16ft_4_minimus_184 TaxID=1665175 RepID=A0A0H4T4X6_9DELT|nr:preprotein translocase subunit SecY, preprotein translocase subunit SecY [uncultured delta proteobacterium Rifle_16ft_4_minimus_184]OGP20714.1 MAG: preprotein translocase subunit SecY [Deltaproteobacteria bacterium GWA2_65_63]OGP28262.1 MAG: preprotein translocase subunit SecY [Deltaproteobacteria bacterium GWB2_65_81]OGP40351.1 MAG: preprotein translocase subunit SecY [Deltaproteobacteria bacterium GWC2_66_88]OGP77959.1 MAG: preprotein translocase subunit SecY [Deltaproteobacteria bacterium